MSNKSMNATVMLMIGILVIGFFSYAVYWAFFDMSRLPTGELLTEATSPNGEYTIELYLSPGSAVTSDAVLGKLIMHHKKQQSKNIYWNEEETAEIEWLDDDTVTINGRVLHVPTDTYDFRNDEK